MEEILHQLIGSLSHYLQGFIHPRWCRISFINSSMLVGEVYGGFSWLNLPTSHLSIFGKIGWLNTGNASVIKQPFAKGVTFPLLPCYHKSLCLFVSFFENCLKNLRVFVAFLFKSWKVICLSLQWSSETLWWTLRICAFIQSLRHWRCCRRGNCHGNSLHLKRWPS